MSFQVSAVLGNLLAASVLSPSAPAQPPAAGPTDDALPPGATARLGSPLRTGPFYFVAYTADGRLITASHDGKIRLWEAATGGENCHQDKPSELRLAARTIIYIEWAESIFVTIRRSRLSESVADRQRWPLAMMTA